MKKLLLMAALAFCTLTRAYARDPGSRLAMPGFEDPTNAAEAFAVTVGSTTSTKIYTPNQNRDERSVRITNESPLNSVHITTWSLNDQVPLTCATCTAIASYLIHNATSSWNILDLNAITTFYARYDPGVSSGTVRGMLFWNDQSKKR